MTIITTVILQLLLLQLLLQLLLLQRRCRDIIDIANLYYLLWTKTRQNTVSLKLPICWNSQPDECFTQTEAN